MGKRWRILLPGLALAGAVAALVLLRGTGGEARLPAPTEEPGPVAAAPAPAAEEALPEAAALAGVVLDTGGAPLPDAEVRARALAADAWPAPFDDAPAETTDGRGRFELRTLPPGSYLLEVRDERGRGFLPVVRVSEGHRTAVTVRLLPEAEIRGRVVDENHVPIANAEVTTDLAGVIAFFRRDGEPPPGDVEKRVRAVTDGEGRFALTRLPIGLYDLRITAPAGRHRVIPGVAAPVDGVDLTLWDGYDVPVVVAWPKDVRPERIVVETVPADAREELRAEGTAANATVTVLLPGRYEVSASAPGFLVARGVVEVADGRRTEPVELHLEPAVPATVRVRGADGAGPIAGADVLLFGPRPEYGSARSEVRGTTDAEGIAEFHLRPGPWAAVARADGWRSSFPGDVLGFREMPASAVRVAADGPVEWDLELPPDWVFEGRVTFEDGTPAPGYFVGASCRKRGCFARDRTNAGWTGWDGRFRITGGHGPGLWTVSVRYERDRYVEVENVRFPAGHRRVEVNVVLPIRETRTRAFRGRVVDETGEPVPRALVYLAGKVTGSGADGTFEIPDFLLFLDAPGAVVAAGHPITTFVCRKGRDDSDVLRVVLPWLAPWLSGTVRNSAGEPIPGAALRVFERWAEETLLVTRTDRDGKWSTLATQARHSRHSCHFCHLVSLRGLDLV